MYSHKMTLDQLAAFNRANGMKVQQIGGTWWAEVRPFFFRPLFPFTEIDNAGLRYPKKSLLGGVLHAVSPSFSANTSINLFVYEDPQGYSLQSLGETHRRRTRKGMKHFTVRRILDLEEFIAEAYEIYLSFYSRTNYQYKKERLRIQHFTAWSHTLFSFPHIVVLGAYHAGKLSAIDVSYRVEDVVIDDIFFSDTASQQLQVTDVMLHALREAAASSDAKYVFKGFPSGKPSLDASKILRGCKILSKPAFFKFNPVALFAAKHLMKESYAKLLTMTSPSTPYDTAVEFKPAGTRTESDLAA
ncbi:hypothetical protein [Geobacter sp. DSM 9736]|uniref:hypothetical protein n=1 Tax=Geobacter sp. DSM 9736 TaxID=1277350 RepID=UPI000B50CF32|nr:hypothetical protein [Geobacter sp. DSM 9736]SNB47660.1 hypothetical protein SAMN06269301_3152 [Geobacter sp. DSM 9736]